MGNKNSIPVIENLENLCDQYIEIVKKVNEVKRIFLNEELLRDNVQIYLEKFDSNQQINLNEFSMYWIWSVHKLYPMQYKNKKKLEKEFLFQTCLKQKKFYLNLKNDLKNYKFKKWLKDYEKFLKLIKKNPFKDLAPTLKQDFIWQAHMQDNEQYIKYTLEYLGKILDHNENLISKKSEETKINTQFVKKKNKKKVRIISPNYNKNYYLLQQKLS